MKNIVKIFFRIFYVFALIVMLSIHFQGRSFERKIMEEESEANAIFLEKIAGQYTLDVKEHPENKANKHSLQKHLNTSNKLSYDITSDQPITVILGETTSTYKASIVDKNTVKGYIPDPYEKRIIISWNEEFNTIKGSIIIPISKEEEIILAFDGKRIIE